MWFSYCLLSIESFREVIFYVFHEKIQSTIKILEAIQTNIRKGNKTFLLLFVS